MMTLFEMDGLLTRMRLKLWGREYDGSKTGSFVDIDVPTVLAMNGRPQG